jgi:uncharacterized protein (DUF4415 family)
VDKHVIQPHEYDDIPDLSTPYWRKRFEAVIKKQGGRPKIENPKVSTTIRLDADVLEHFRKLGPGWQSRINATLRSVMKRRAA